MSTLVVPDPYNCLFLMWGWGCKDRQGGLGKGTQNIEDRAIGHLVLLGTVD